MVERSDSLQLTLAMNCYLEIPDALRAQLDRHLLDLGDVLLARKLGELVFWQVFWPFRLLA